MSYQEIIILHESQVLIKVFEGFICSHFRLYNNSIVYYKDKLTNNNDCIYCYSNKKSKKYITVFISKTDFYNKENHDFLSFLEENELIVEIIDYNNTTIKNIKNENCALIGNIFYSFNEAMDIIINKEESKDCSNIESKNEFKLLNKVSKEDVSYKEKRDNSLNCLKFNKNPYNFINKLQLYNKELLTSFPDINTDNLLEYSFQS